MRTLAGRAGIAENVVDARRPGVRGRRQSDRSIERIYWQVWGAGALAGLVVGFLGAFLLL